MLDPYLPLEAATDAAQAPSAGPSVWRVVAVGTHVILALGTVGIGVLLVIMYVTLGNALRGAFQSQGLHEDLVISAFVAFLKYSVQWLDTWWAEMLTKA